MEQYRKYYNQNAKDAFGLGFDSFVATFVYDQTEWYGEVVVFTFNVVSYIEYF